MLKRLTLLSALALGLAAPGFPQTETNLNNFGSAPVFQLTTPTNGQCLSYSSATAKWINSACGAGGILFNAITSGTNTTAAMLVGTGASLAASGSGTIAATSLTALTGLPSQADGTLLCNSTGSPASASACPSPTLSGTLQANGGLTTGATAILGNISVGLGSTYTWSGSQSAAAGVSRTFATMNAAGSSSGNPIAYDYFGVSSDTLQNTSGTASYGLYYAMNGSTGLRGARNAIGSNLNIVGVPGDTGQYAAGFFEFQASAAANAGGNIGYGFNPYCNLNAAATGSWSCVGGEIDISARTSSTPVTKTGLQIVLVGNDAVHGSANNDSALVFGTQVGAATGWDYGIRFSSAAFAFPFVNTAKLIYVPTPLSGGTIADFIDGSNLTYSDAFIKSSNFKVDGSGNINGGSLNSTPIGNTTASTIVGSTITATTKVFSVIGTNSITAFGPSTNTATGLYFNTANQINLSANSTQVLGCTSAACTLGAAGNAETISGSVLMPNLASSSAATTGTLCWTTVTGNVNVDTTLACLSSTKRVKQHIQPLDAGLAEVMKLRPISYDLKPEFNPKGLGPMVGLVAEEVQKIDPRLVGTDEEGKALGVRYMQYTALLTKAIQEQQAEITELKRELKRMHSRGGARQ